MNESLGYPIKEFGYDKSGTCKNLTGQCCLDLVFAIRPALEGKVVL